MTAILSCPRSRVGDGKRPNAPLLSLMVSVSVWLDPVILTALVLASGCWASTVGEDGLLVSSSSNRRRERGAS